MSPIDRFLPLLHGRSFAHPRVRFRHGSFPEAFVILSAPNRPWIHVNCPRVSCEAWFTDPGDGSQVWKEIVITSVLSRVTSALQSDRSGIIVKFRNPREIILYYSCADSLLCAHGVRASYIRIGGDRVFDKEVCKYNLCIDLCRWRV